MFFWCLQIDQKRGQTKTILGTLYHYLDDFTLTLLHIHSGLLKTKVTVVCIQQQTTQLEGLSTKTLQGYAIGCAIKDIWGLCANS
jgi:hypothetical protein